MTQEKTYRAEVLLGSRNKYSDGQEFSGPGCELTYSLIIDNNPVAGAKLCGVITASAIERQANEVASKLKEYGIEDYLFTDGERIRFTNYKRINVDPMPEPYKTIFKQTLYSRIKNQNGDYRK